MGFGEPGMQVSVCIQEQQIFGKISHSGRFELELPRLLPGGPYALTIQEETKGNAQVYQVFVGDVFVCAGQSNMELPMRRVAVRYPEEFENGGCEGVHIYKVMENPEFQQTLQEHREAAWHTCGKKIWKKLLLCLIFWGNIYMKKGEFLLEF